MFGHIADLSPWWTGLALLNASTQDTVVEVFAINPGGSLIGGPGNVATARFPLAASTRIAKLLQDIIPQTQTRTADGGFVFVRSINNVPIYGMQLFFRRDLNVISNIAGEIPAVPFAPPR